MSWLTRNRQILLLNNLIRNQFNSKYYSQYNKIKNVTPLLINYNNSIVQLKKNNLEIILRYKHKKNTKQDSTDSEGEEEQDDNENEIVDKLTKIVNTKVNSLRADLILKAGLGIARNKIETAFYESKIRVNGKKILKKSVMCQVGDELDIIRGPSPTNPEFLIVSRVEILSASERSEGLNVKLRRNKSLTIENYENEQ